MWLRYDPATIDLFDTSTAARLETARQFDSKLITVGFAAQRIAYINGDLVEGLRQRRAQATRSAQSNAGTRNLLAEVLRSYAISKGASPDGRPAITTTCTTNLGITTCTTR